VSRPTSRDSSHGRLIGLDRLRLREPGEVDVLDRASESLGLELGAAEPFFDSHDEYLIEGLNSQTIQLFMFWLSFHMAVLLSDRGLIPLILAVPAV
jgi:hypothetical protein